MERIRKAHADTLELARAQLITAGTVYSPTGTAALDWNAEFGWTRVVVDFTLGTSTTDVLEKIEAGLASVQDNANGQTHTGYVVLTSPEFFAKLIKHASVKQAYQYYTSTQEPLRQRLGGPLTKNRMFDFGGVTFVEMRDTAPNGTRHIPAGKAYLVLQGTDVTVQMISVDPSKNGWFDPATGTVYLNLDGPHETGIVETLLHELVHAGTERAISNPVTPAQKALVDSLQKQMDSARKAAADLIKSKLGITWHGNTDTVVASQ
jgi:hypothetical protein